MIQFDAIVIGTGQAGPSLAVRMAGEGMKVAIIERNLFYGTCVNTGCTPTKALIASARAAYMARRSAEYGVKINGPVTVDMKRVKERKDDITGRENDKILHISPEYEDCKRIAKKKNIPLKELFQKAIDNEIPK